MYPILSFFGVNVPCSVHASMSSSNSPRVLRKSWSEVQKGSGKCQATPSTPLLSGTVKASMAR
jgi:hypothetical protein